MSTRTILTLALIMLFTAVGCERRDIGGDTGADEASSGTTSEDSDTPADRTSDADVDDSEKTDPDRADAESSPTSDDTGSGSSHQTRAADPECGADPAPDEFVERVASEPVDHMTFYAARDDADREKRAEYTGVNISGPNGGTSEPIASCNAFFDRVRASGSTESLGRAPYEVQADFMKLSYNGHSIFDAATDVCIDFCAQKSAIAGDSISSAIEGLSLVGPVLSYKRSTSEAMGGGPPYHGDDWGAIDLRTMQPAEFDALVEPGSILTALQHDSYIRRHNTLSTTVKQAENLHAALEALRDELDGVNAYSFHYYYPRNNLVAMRIPFREGTYGLSPNRMSEIGIWVEPREEWIPYFKAARNAPKGGFYMTNFDMAF